MPPVTLARIFASLAAAPRRGDPADRSADDPWMTRASRLGPEYSGGLASHVPMVLAALRALGADEARQQAVVRGAEARFAADPQAGPAEEVGAEALAAAGGAPGGRVPDACGAAPCAASAASAASAAPPRADSCAGSAASPCADADAPPFGDLGAWPAGVRHYRARLAAEGRAALLRRLLPALMPGVAAAAFHGLIRVGHAVEGRHDGELARALAYWAARWLPLPAPPGGPAPGPPLAVGAWLAAVAAAEPARRPEGALIVDRVAALLAQGPAGPHAALAGRLRIGPRTLAALTAQAARDHLAGGNFTVLHLITAGRALRVLLPWFDAADRPAAVAHFASAWAAARLSCGQRASVASARPRPLPGRRRGWPSVDELARRACASDDDHVVKGVHACLDEARAAGLDSVAGRRFLRAAARMLAA